MSRRNSSYRTNQLDPNENDPETLLNPPVFPPSRAPLNAIQNLPENSEKEPLDSCRAKFTDLPPSNKGLANFTTPKTVRGKAQSEPNSAHSTPTKTVHRVCSNGFAVGRAPQCSSGYRGGGSCSRVPRGICTATGSASAEVPHIDLVENSSFWMDHNVQVLIRIRPISSTERALQGYGRCLRQESPHTLTWLGNPEARFTFDHVACETVTQEMLFKVAGLPMVENCMSGYNSCMFAYGQTGSGKTYTMMGEIFEEMDNKLSEDRGMTPRIFEYLFMRIREEEEKWRDKELKYSCKCSFLEIYNEQITDLLEPSSTNLQLREDMQKGVYVENLTEYEVRNVKDVIELLFQGAANRKMAATNMNSESSRSHSVFTCVIESRWEKDAMTHLRFGRLNLVDLAGSERQKSSGAEGERLKEAANINKSLSTLGLVIMTLVDVAHGKHRHVPYRDSRLTFLLQDSLGGNSKTTIIANISPSNCCANETLSTLKFAQRAKLIQNNAKVNEDASGDVMALQRQIQQLKDQLTFFLKHQNALSCPTFSDHGNYGDSLEEYDPPQEINFSHALHGNASPLHKTKAFDNPRASNKKIKYLEATLTGTLRREKHAENEVQRLEAQIEHMNRLIHQREDDNQRTRMMLRFQEEKIRRLEMLANGLVSGDDYLMEENSALSEEIQLLRARIDRNPELTHFAMENIRLLEQVRMFQNFYEQGERETLLAEVSELRDQLLEALTEQSGQVKYPFGATENGAKVSAADVQHLEVYSTLEELENCKKKLVASLETNARLAREIDDLRNQLSEYVDCKEAVFHTVEDFSSMDAVTIAEADHYQLLKKTKETRTICQQLNPQVEADVVEKVLCIAEQHADIQPEADLGDAVELRDRLCLMNLENTRLAKSLTDRDEDIMAFTSFVEKLEKDTMDLTSLADGYDQPETTADLFPETRVWISGKLERAVKLLIQKDNIIADLQKALEGAQKMVLEMKMNIRSLRGATRAITEVQQQENNERCKEIIQLRMLLNEKSSTIDKLENKIKYSGDQIPEESLANNLAIKNIRIQESNQSQNNEFDDGELYAYFIESNSSCGQVKEICQSCTSGIYEHQLEGDHNEEKIKFAMLEMGRMLQTFEKRMEEAEAGCRKAREMLCLKLSDARLVAAEKSNQANTLLLKFEEAQETIEEADLVLNALLKANENAKHEADVWKQAGKELMAERAVLIEEVQQLKASASLMEKQCEFTDSISSLEESLVQIQTDLEETFKVVYHDIFSFGRELIEFIVTARSLLEDIWSDMIEKDFSLFVVHQCYLGFFHDKVTGSIPRSLEVAMDRTNLISENLLLKKELVRKDVLLKGLLFDFRLLQESASNAMDIKDETEEMMASLRQVQHELAIKTTLFDDISVQHRMLEAEISAKKAALLVSQSELEQAKGALELASKENIELKVLLDDIHSRNAITEKQLEEKYNVIEDLGKEILRLDSSVEQKILSSTEVIDNALRRVSNERDRLRAEVVYLKDQLEMAHALADENEAIAVEARQLSEASKIYAEQKEEEAKILERSVEELEFTINVLEKKVYEMGEEVDRQCLMREDLELELEALRPRMLTIQNATGSLDTSSSNVEEGDDPISREIGRHEFHEAKRRIQILERERSEQAEKIKQYEDYISELVLHAEAQTSQYHQKYTALEAMVREAKTESSSNSSTSIVNKTDKTRIRGSGSPFKCIAGLVQQMNSEKDQELSAARLRIEELEALAASRQKEVCMLSARLAAAESMTHDVIRDLLGVKLDMTNYANLIDQQQVQKLAEKAQQLSEESSGKELEILKLREQINDFIDERESLIREIHQRRTDTLAAQVAVEQLQQRDQLLAAQNEMLKMDKENLKRKVVGLDELVKKLSRSHNFQQRIHQHTKIKESSSSRSRNDDLMKRLAHSAKLLSRVDDVHSQFHRCDGGDPNLDSDKEQG